MWLMVGFKRLGKIIFFKSFLSITTIYIYIYYYIFIFILYFIYLPFLFHPLSFIYFFFFFIYIYTFISHDNSPSILYLDDHFLHNNQTTTNRYRNLYRCLLPLLQRSIGPNHRNESFHGICRFGSG